MLNKLFKCIIAFSVAISIMAAASIVYAADTQSEVVGNEQEQQADGEYEITPYMVNISSIKTTLSFSSGMATFTCYVAGIPTTTKITVEGEYQQYVNGNWKFKSKSTQTFTATHGTYSRRATAQSGNKYRVKFVVSVYVGSSVETRTVYSLTKQA